MSRLVRIRNGYSDRNKIREISKVIQFASFDSDTRIVLKNEIIVLLEEFEDYLLYNMNNSDVHRYVGNLFAKEVFNLPLHNGYNNYNNIIAMIYSVFESEDINDILDFIEYFCNNVVIKEKKYNCNYQEVWIKKDLKIIFNNLFEKECIGYRFIDNFITPITNKEEIESIEKSVNSKFDKVSNHMKNALHFISSRSNRNYKDVITECVKSLECLLNIILKKDGLVLSDALKQFCSTNKRMHKALQKSIIDLYGYASDGAGLRHDMNNKDYNEGLEEAKLILVTTSALINYIISIG